MHSVALPIVLLFSGGLDVLRGLLGRMVGDSGALYGVYVKVRTLVSVPLTGKPTSEALKVWHAL